MKVAVMLIVIDEHWTIPEVLERGLEEVEIGGWGKTIQITVFLWSVGYYEES